VSVLAKGGNFAVTPKTIPVEEIISGVESAVRNLPANKADKIRCEASRIVEKARLPVCNLSRDERMALAELKSNQEVVVLRADKGNATVVLNTGDYERKIQTLLSPDTYKVCTKDPTTSVERRTNHLLRNCGWSKDVVKNLVASESVPPRLYGLPKIHKEGAPLRPIVSAIGSPTYKLSKYLSNLMQPLIGHSVHHIRNSAHFIEIIKNIEISTQDLLVSFDVESLFTMVPINETLTLLREHFTSEILELFRHCLSSSYFLWNGTFYEQKDGVAMGGPLSPVVANFFMEWFEKTALERALKKPMHWFRYVDDTFVVWQHGLDSLHEFLNHLNSLHPRIKFTMELESNGKLPFLDVLVTKKESGSLGHSVYRKPTHTDRYLNATSNHHPSQKRALIKTLAHRARTICDPESLDGELGHLSGALESNGYTERQIRSVINPRVRPEASEERESSTDSQPKAYLPYLECVTDRISRVLRKEGISTIFKPSRKIDAFLRPVKDKIDPLKTPGVYSIPCECGSEYVGMTDRSIATRRKEHQRSIRLNQPDKSAVAEHALSEGHIIEFNNTKVLARVKGFHNLMRREAIEIAQRPNNMNRDNGAGLNRFWTRLLTNKQLPVNNNTERSVTPDLESSTSLTALTRVVPEVGEPALYNGPATRSRTALISSTCTRDDRSCDSVP
jgi:hypothetical protein